MLLAIVCNFVSVNIQLLSIQVALFRLISFSCNDNFNFIYNFGGYLFSILLLAILPPLLHYFLIIPMYFFMIFLASFWIKLLELIRLMCELYFFSEYEGE